MNEKLIALLESVGLSHDLLNHTDFATRREARKRLAKYYGEYDLILEVLTQSGAAKIRQIDGVTVSNATFSSIIARTFANSAHGLQNWRFVTFAKLDKVIPVQITEGVTETTVGKIGTIRGIVTSANTDAKLLGVSIEPKENELRGLDDIPEDAETEEVEKGLDNQIEIFVEKEFKKRGKKSV